MLTPWSPSRLEQSGRLRSGGLVQGIFFNSLVFLAAAREKHFPGSRKPAAVEESPEQTAVAQAFFSRFVQKTAFYNICTASVAIAARVHGKLPVA